MLSIEHLLQFQRANLLQFSSVFYQITERTVSVFYFLWVTQCSKIQSDFCLIYLTSRRKIQKNNHSKMLSTKKMKNPASWGSYFRFLALQFSKTHCFIAVLCVLVFLVLVFTWILAWVCTLYCFIIDLLWKSIHHFICYCFAMTTSAIWLSTIVLLILLFSSILVHF